MKFSNVTNSVTKITKTVEILSITPATGISNQELAIPEKNLFCRDLLQYVQTVLKRIPTLLLASQPSPANHY